ncbi:MAG: FAD-dependent oxidoreductase [Ilumatobacteraceae bacterium]
MTGWGRTAPSAASVVESGPDRLPGLLAEAGERGVIVRGLGRSYGDPAQNAGGTVVRLPDDLPIVLDRNGPVAHVGAGTSLDRVMRELVPQGFFVPVTPGTRFVTVGGAIASDIHGKGHHRDGTFGSNVERFRLMLADGTVIEASPSNEHAELFWATVGGS